jgi:protein-S-isoprenylcysteine O-methyltransferase Ste14
MVGVALGAAAFFLIFWVDALSLKDIRRVQPVLWILSVLLFAAGLVLCADPAGSSPVVWPLRALGWFFCAAFGLLLVYSLFIEIPLFQPAHGLVSRGTYALCRHPGVLWLAGFLAALLLARGSRWLLVAAPVWIALDVLLAFLQERLFFIRMFGNGYRAYQRTVPMFIPTAYSLLACTQTIFRREEQDTR